MRIEDAKIIMGELKMDCSKCPYIRKNSCHCEASTSCSQVALEAGRMVMAEASKDAYEMAFKFGKLLLDFQKMKLSENLKKDCDKELANVYSVQLKYERAVDNEN